MLYRCSLGPRRCGDVNRRAEPTLAAAHDRAAALGYRYVASYASHHGPSVCHAGFAAALTAEELPYAARGLPGHDVSLD